MTARGQTFTLEAFVAAILLLATVAFALHVVAISSNTASAGDAETRSQNAELARGVLDTGAADGTLRETLVYWNEAEEEFYDADVDPDDGGHYVSRHPPTMFGESLGAMFDDRQVRYNVDLYFRIDSGDRGHQRLVESGTPSDDAVRVVETVTLYNHTTLTDETGSQRDVTLGEVADDETSDFYAPDVRADSRVYNVVRVEVTVWRT